MDITTHPEPHSAAVILGRSPAVRPSAHRALAARDRLLAGYPLWEAWRRQARGAKTEAVARLDELLDDLERAVTAWGGRVLRARDAAQARQLILDVAREHGVKTVVKAKSMTTEEIGLNPALAAAGLQVMETDLGEFIVQLAGHPPAHLTAPALHLNRHQIADLFAAHLGLQSPAEPEALARLATSYIKPHFFAAQMGITGVNFATPEGTLVLLENESNLRFTATLPKVHLALMGLEKVIPQLSDLEVMLRLLPASATGQRLTALVHFIQGLKIQPQGNQIFYLVILDNGRRRLAADPELAEALYCLRCGACLNVCPIFQVGAAHLYGRVYPGAIGILLAPYLAPVGDICDLCTQCGACQEICPVGIRLADKIRGLRRRSRRFRPLRALTTAAGAVLSRPRWYRAWSRPREGWPFSQPARVGAFPGSRPYPRRVSIGDNGSTGVSPSWVTMIRKGPHCQLARHPGPSRLTELKPGGWRQKKTRTSTLSPPCWRNGFGKPAVHSQRLRARPTWPGGWLRKQSPCGWKIIPGCARWPANSKSWGSGPARPRPIGPPWPAPR